MDRRQFLRVAGGGVIAAAVPPLLGCSSELPAAAVAAWRQPMSETDPRRWALAHAILAPHSHNLQSWLVDLSVPDEITLRVDLDRLLPQTDPLSRQMIMSQGTFLELLDLAARERGLRADMTLFPQGVFDERKLDARPTARIRLVHDATVRPDPLFAQIFKRHTNRAPYDMREPAPPALAAIAASVAGAPVRIGFAGPQQVSLVQAQREIAMQAWQIELVTPRTLLESYNVLRVGPAEIAQHRDGIALNEPLVRALVALGLFDRTRASSPDSSAVQGQIKSFNEKLAATPAFFWMITEGNHRATQLQAGRAYARAQLAATAHGLSMHPLQQALQEYPEQARPYAAIHQLLGATPPQHTVQMWARLGYGPAAVASPRRGLQAHITKA